MPGLTLLAKDMATKNKTLDYKPNAVLNLVNGNATDKSDIISKITTMVGNEVSMYRNLLLPFVKEYKNEVTKLVANKLGSVDMSKYRVIPIAMPSVIKQYFEKNLISKESKSIQLPVGNLIIDNPGADKIRAYLKSDTPSTQMYLDELLLGITDEDLINIWDKYLLNVSGSNDNIDMLGYRGVENIVETSILFVLVDKLTNNIPDTVRVAANTYTKIMREFSFKLSGDMAKIAKTLDYNKQMDKLVISINGGFVYVDSVLYKKFLEENTVEVLLGMTVSDIKTKNHYLSDILVNKNSYITAWNNKYKLMTMAVRSQDITAYRLAYELALDELYKDMQSDIAEKVSVGLLEAKNIVNAFVKRSSIEDLSEVSEVSKTIATDLILGDTNFGLFMNYMTGYAKMDDSLTPQEAASFATLDIIVDYLAEQTTVIGG